MNGIYLVLIEQDLVLTLTQGKGQVWKVETFHLAPRLMGLYTLFMEIEVCKVFYRSSKSPTIVPPIELKMSLFLQ